MPYIVDTADYLGTLPPPRQATWGKVLALRRALDECTDATLPFQSHCLEQGGKEQPQPQQQEEEEEQQQQQQQQQRRLPPSAVLLLDADCALMGTADMLKALLSAGGGDDDECGGSGTARSAPRGRPSGAALRRAGYPKQFLHSSSSHLRRVRSVGLIPNASSSWMHSRVGKCKGQYMGAKPNTRMQSPVSKCKC